MKIIHVIPHISEEASGPSYSVPRLCEALAECGNDVEIACLAKRSEIPGVRIEVHPEWPVLKRLAISSSHASALWRKAGMADIVHNHSLWSMVNIATGLIVPGRGAKLVTSPRGTLSLWAMSRTRAAKRLLWPLQRPALARADLLHATSDMERRDIRRHGFRAPIALIPNGIDVPPLPERSVRSRDGLQTLFFLGRIHPTKGLDNLLHAWAHLQGGHPSWRLVIAGKGSPAHIQELQELAKTIGLARVEFPGPLFGVDKSAAYFGAGLFVLPSHSENFGMVVAEALAHGCPAVVSRGAPWSELESKGCGWWVHNGSDKLAYTLDVAMALPSEQRVAMGLRGRAWMERDYSWHSIGQKMDLAYRWLLYGGGCPSFVDLAA